MNNEVEHGCSQDCNGRGKERKKDGAAGARWNSCTNEMLTI